jgi:iron(III) transport system permease protein
MFDARSWSLVENTLLLIAGTLAISLPLGTFLAVALFRTDVYLRRAAIVAVGLLLLVPLYIQAVAWQNGFGSSGWFTLLTSGPYQAGLLEGWRGAIWVHAMAAVPWVTLIVGAAIRFVEPELEEMALLDGTAWQTLTRVTLRQARAAIGLAAVWVSIVVATEMTVTDLFQIGPVRLRTYAEEIYTQFALGTEPGPPPAALTGVALIGSLSLCAVLLCIKAGNWRPQLSSRPPLVYRLNRWRGLASIVVIGIVLGMIGLPLGSLIYKAGAIVVPTSGQFARSWSFARCIELIADSPVRYRHELTWSLAIASCAAFVAAIVALLLALLARRGRWFGVPAICVSVACLAVPGPLVGVGLIALFNHPSLPLLNALYDRSIAVVSLAQAIRAFPVAMLIVWQSLRTIPVELLDAAALDGAGRWSRFWRVVWPLRWPTFGLARLAAFIVAIGELSATILVVPPGVETLGVRVAQMLHANTLNDLAGLCLFLLIALAILAAATVTIWRFMTARDTNPKC